MNRKAGSFIAYLFWIGVGIIIGAILSSRFFC